MDDPWPQNVLVKQPIPDLVSDRCENNLHVIC